MVAAGALTIDVGNINADRRQLQNGSDAVALAVARTCAITGTCPNANDSTLKPLANANAADGFTKIRRVDGQTPWTTSTGTPTASGTQAICGVGPGLYFCPTSWTSSTGNLQECPPVSSASSAANYVRVYAETESANAAHDTILPYSFGAAIAGAGTGANQQTCSSVAWGTIAGGPAPITISYCEWAHATGNDPANPGSGTGTYAASPDATAPGYGGAPPQPAWPYPAAPLPAAPIPGNEIIISLQGTANTTCPTWNGHDVPGGFGYLSTASSCNTPVSPTGWLQTSPGNSLTSACDFSQFFNTVIYLPVFDCTKFSNTGSPTSPPIAGDPNCLQGTGNNTWYHVEGYAAFYLSGYKTGGGPSDTRDRTQAAANPKPPCSGNDRCLSGWFLKGLAAQPLAPPPIGPPGPPLGQYTIQLVG